MYKVYVINNRPDFRVLIDLLYDRSRDVDTDGDSNPVNSRDWTNLYIKDRKSDDSAIEIAVASDNSNIFEIESRTTHLEELASLYLFEYCGSSIEHNRKKLSRVEVEIMKQKYFKALNRAKYSIWHNSSDNNPYPNSTLF